MNPKTIRVFVGNLPPDTVEDDLNKLLKKYVTVLTVEIKRRTNDVFAFVDLENPKLDLNTCFHELSRKQWKGRQLTFQRARESFLQRLARERLENNVSVKKENISLETQHNINYISKCTYPCDYGVVNTLKRNNHGIHGDDDYVSIDDTCDSEIPIKGNLKMFQGTTAIFQKKSPQKIPNLNFNKISTNKINEEKEILESFEMFNDVWKDEPSEIAAEKITNCNAKSASQKKEKKPLNSNVRIQGNESSQMNGDLDHKGVVAPIEISQLKHIEAEERRLKAIHDRNKEILHKKRAIQLALASIDSHSNANRPNKKILFTDDNASEGDSRNYCSKRESKLTLFSDDEMEQEMDNENDFRIRKHYEGEKGQSLLSLQARYGNDKRFILDERFIESDAEQEEGEKVENDDTQAEREKVLRILGNVLGEKIPDTNKTKSKQTAKLMLRYDPSKPDHTKFEIKKDSNQKAMRKKTVENDNESVAPGVIVKPKEETNILPVVSKERYYQVSETLRETLENKNQKFSLSAMFGEENENEIEKDNDVNLEAKPIIGKKEWSLKPFQNDLSASEDENVTNDQMVSEDHYSEHYVGVKQESLFFEENDARFTEALEFISSRNEEYMKNFDKIRHRVKTIIKHKISNHKKNSERWRKKFGGGNRKPFSGKHQKTNIRR